MNRLLLVCILALISLSATQAADSKLDKLNVNDRAVIQKLLAIDPKLEWMLNVDRVTLLGFSPHGATTAAIALLPQLTGLTTLNIHKDAFQRVEGWRPGDMTPLSRCPKLHVLGIVIAEHHTPEVWKSLPVLPEVNQLKIFDQAAGHVTISDRCPNATRVILWSGDLTQFDAGQFGKHTRLKQLDLFLEKSPWTGEGLSRLSNCPSVEELRIRGEGLTDIALRELGSLRTFKTLGVLGGKFTPQGFESFTDFESLTFSDDWFTDEMAMGLKNCHTLKRLDVRGTKVHGACFKVLAKLPLESISASKIRLEDLHLLKECKTLEGLRLEAKTKMEYQLQNTIWEAIGQQAILQRDWTGTKGDDPQ